MTNSLYERFIASASGRRATALLARHHESLRDMFEVVFQFVAATIPTLEPERRYTAKEICGQALWGEWPFSGQKYAAGMSLYFLVKAGALNLVHHKTKSGKGPKKYFVPANK